MTQAESRRDREIRETAETLIEDRGAQNAIAWADHCMVRDSSGGFWRAVRDCIARSQGWNFRRENGEWTRIAED